MTDIDTAALRAAAEGATPGPWEWDGAWGVNKRERPTSVVGVVDDADVDDAAYIAAANPAVVLELLERLAAAEGALRWIASDAPHDGPDDAEDAMHDRAMVALALGSTGNPQGPQIDAQERA